ncbi:MAG: hypothetical protein KBD14_02170 [Candidatus Pacebacteria bacterium]|nr:hypothetical protein [Candidatus Paceibacterota bacterium]
MLKILKNLALITLIYITFSHFYGANIRAIPKYWKIIPLLHTEMASSIYPNIYLTKSEYQEYTNNNMSTWTKSVLIHEDEHIKNWKNLGYLKFPYLYLFNKDFRLEEELRAIKTQMIFLKENNTPYDIKRKALQFSGKEYGNLMTYEEAYTLLSETWLNTNPRNE